MSLLLQIKIWLIFNSIFVWVFILFWICYLISLITRKSLCWDFFFVLKAAVLIIIFIIVEIWIEFVVISFPFWILICFILIRHFIIFLIYLGIQCSLWIIWLSISIIILWIFIVSAHCRLIPNIIIRNISCLFIHLNPILSTITLFK